MVGGGGRREERAVGSPETEVVYGTVSPGVETRPEFVLLCRRRSGRRREGSEGTRQRSGREGTEMTQHSNHSPSLMVQPPLHTRQHSTLLNLVKYYNKSP